MKINHLFCKWMTVADGMRVPVSRHFRYSQIGVRGRYAAIDMYGAFLTTDAPGVGFFMKSSDSHSYRKFVNEYKQKQKQNFWTLISGKEPNFDRQIKLVEGALETCSNDPEKAKILATYQSCLYIAKEAEMLERIVQGIKDKMGSHTNKLYVSVVSHYKSRIATLDHDIRAAQINVKNGMDEAKLASWGNVVDQFHQLVDARRVWSVKKGGVESPDAFVQVFADMGIFDFVQSPFDTPILRDYNGTHYYFYPSGIVRARSSVDFDMIPYHELTVKASVVDLNSLSGGVDFTMTQAGKNKNKKYAHSDVVSSLYGQTRGNTLGALSFPELDLTFLCNHVGPTKDFADALNKYLER